MTDPEGTDDEVVHGELVGGGDGDPGGANPLEALFGGGSMPDLGSLMEGLSSMQDIQGATYEGSAGGGLVRITASGRMEVHDVVIEPGAIEGDGDAPDLELLADLVLAALNDLTAKITAAQEQAMGGLGGLLGQ
jgi:DNA-binding protein YbaB